MIYLPYAADLLAQARVVLAGMAEDAAALRRYELLMALNALGIAERELRDLDPVNAAAISECAPLAGIADTADRPDALGRQAQVERLIAISRRLKSRIRAGVFDGEEGAALKAALRQHCSRSLQISNPKALAQ